MEMNCFEKIFTPEELYNIYYNKYYFQDEVIDYDFLFNESKKKWEDLCIYINSKIDLIARKFEKKNQQLIN